MNIWETLKTKYYGIPMWLYVAAGILGLALYLNHRKSSQPSNSDQAAADQTNSDLGSASALATEFWQAGIMPYMGGDVYVTQTNTAAGATTPVTSPPSTQPAPVTGAPTPPPRVTHPVTTPKTTAKALPSSVDTAYKVEKGDTLSEIAKRYGLTTSQLWNYNIGTGSSNSAMRPASTIATLKARGQNLLYSGETIMIPKKGTVYAGGA